MTGGRGADVVFDFVGTDATHAGSLELLGRGGTYSVIGYGGEISCQSAALVVNEQTVVGNLVGSWIDLWELVQLHAAGRVRLVSETHPLDSVNDVLARLRVEDLSDTGGAFSTYLLHHRADGVFINATRAGRE